MKDKHYAGDPCPTCGDGILGVYMTRVVNKEPEPVRVQYLKCRDCGAVPEENKVIFPARYSPLRPRKLRIRRRR